MTLMKNVNGQDVPMTAEEEAAILAEWNANSAAAAETYYKQMRVVEYPAISDQIDVLYKTLLHLRSNGIDVGTEGTSWLDQITSIKENYPKPA